MARGVFAAIVGRHLGPIAEAVAASRAGGGEGAVTPPSAAVVSLGDRCFILVDEAAPPSRCHVYRCEGAGGRFVAGPVLEPGPDRAALLEAARRAVLRRPPNPLAGPVASEEFRRGAPSLLLVPDTSAWFSRLPAPPAAIALGPEHAP